MALGDGSTWDETTPTDATVGVQIDDYVRDVRIGVRGRLALEHEWPSSQSVTSQAGMHKFITMQAQAVKPTLAGTQIGAVYVDTSNNLSYENSAGVVTTIVTGTALAIDLPTLNARLARNFTTVYQATSDGFFVAVASGAPTGTIYFYNDSNATPTTLRVAESIDANSNFVSLNCPVRNGEYYFGTVSGNPSIISAFFMPLV